MKDSELQVHTDQIIRENSSRAITFQIDTELSVPYLRDLLRFIYHNYLLPNRESFTRIQRSSSEGIPSIAFSTFGKEGTWHVDVEILAQKQILVKINPSADNVPSEVLDRLKEDLVINVQLFEEKIRRTTLYFAYVKGQQILHEKAPSAAKREAERLLTGNVLLLYIIMIGLSVVVFSFLGTYAPIAIIAFQFLFILFSDRIIARLGEWTINEKDSNVYLVQYQIPTEEYKQFRAKYGRDLVVEMKREIYEKTLAVGIEPTCEIAGEIFRKFGMDCDPNRMSTKHVNLYELVKKAAETFEIPMPRIVVSNSMIPNAAASGPAPSRGVLLVTTGLLVQLEENEIFSVLGHELGHLKGRDPMVLFALMASEYLLRVYVFWQFLFFSPFLYLIIAMTLVYFVAKFFEARADLQSAIKIGKPEVLAEALQKIGFRRLQFERVPAYRIQSWLNWDPHPPIYFRISRLQKLTDPSKIKHPFIQSAKDVVNGFRAALH